MFPSMYPVIPEGILEDLLEERTIVGRLSVGDPECKKVVSAASITAIQRFYTLSPNPLELYEVEVGGVSIPTQSPALVPIPSHATIIYSPSAMGQTVLPNQDQVLGSAHIQSDMTFQLQWIEPKSLHSYAPVGWIWRGRLLKGNVYRFVHLSGYIIQPESVLYYALGFESEPLIQLGDDKSIDVGTLNASCIAL